MITELLKFSVNNIYLDITPETEKLCVPLRSSAFKSLQLTHPLMYFSETYIDISEVNRENSVIFNKTLQETSDKLPKNENDQYI